MHYLTFNPKAQADANDAVAIICDPCGDRFETNTPPTILYAIEFLSEQVVYHEYIPRNGANKIEAEL